MHWGTDLMIIARLLIRILVRLIVIVDMKTDDTSH